MLRRIPPVERAAALTAVGVSVLLTTVKFLAYGLTGSAAVFSDALESVVNVAASTFALYAIALAHEPADEGHPYGHGKIEFLAALFEGTLILAAGLTVLWHAAAIAWAGTQLVRPGWGLTLVALASLVNLVVGTLLLRVGRRSGSLALEADGWHLLTDVFTSLAVLVSLALVWWTGLRWIDWLAALLMGGYLLATAAHLMRRGAAGLMDEQDRADDALIRSILDGHLARPAGPGICSYHKLRHRHHGRMHWVDFHLCVPRNLTVHEGHELAGAVEGEIERTLGHADATAHVEPCPGCQRCSPDPPDPPSPPPPNDRHADPDPDAPPDDLDVSGKRKRSR